MEKHGEKRSTFSGKLGFVLYSLTLKFWKEESQRLQKQLEWIDRKSVV